VFIGFSVLKTVFFLIECIRKTIQINCLGGKNKNSRYLPFKVRYAGIIYFDLL